eukprot:14508791-Heterocapsa_arctica.AAC.1
MPHTTLRRLRSDSKSPGMVSFLNAGTRTCPTSCIRLGIRSYVGTPPSPYYGAPVEPFRIISGWV